MRIDDLPDLDQPGRRVMNFDSLGIDCLIRLGEVCNNASCPPLGRHVHRDSFEAVFFQTGARVTPPTRPSTPWEAARCS